MRKAFPIVALLVVFCTTFAPNIAARQATPPKADEDPVTLKADLVQVSVVVTDDKGRVRDDLKKEDFEILEENQPQEISFFALNRIGGASPSATAPAGAPAAGSRPPAKGGEPARTIVLFVDTLHISNSSLMRAKKQLKQFVDERVSDRDLVAVVTSSGTLGGLQQFTNDRTVLKYAIDRITRVARAESLFTPYLAAKILQGDPGAVQAAIQILLVEEGNEPNRGGGGGGMMARANMEARARQIQGEEANLRRQTLRVLGALAERLADMPGQRLIGFVSDGFTTVDRDDDVQHEVRKVTGRASRSGVLIYAFNPGGLSAPSEYNASTPGVSNQNIRGYMADSRSDQENVLRTLAGDTGGRAFLNTNDMAIKLREMLSENGTYYTLAWYPSNADKLQFRKMTIRVRNRPSYSVRTQKEFLAFDDATKDSAATPRHRLYKSMVAPLPRTEIPITTYAGFLERETDDAQVSLQVHISGRPLLYQKKDQVYTTQCDVAVVVFDAAGAIAVDFTEVLDVKLTPEQFAQGKKNGFKYENRLALKPGLYQVLVGVRDSGSEKVGTSISWVEIPDLTKGRLELSSLFLAGYEAASNRAEVAGSKPGAKPKLILGRPKFRGGDMAVYSFVVYNADQQPAAANPMVRVSIMQGEAPVFDGAWQTLASRTIRKDRKGIESGGQIKLGLPPGVYGLRVAAKDGKSKKETHQTVEFEIEP